MRFYGAQKKARSPKEAKARGKKTRDKENMERTKTGNFRHRLLKFWIIYFLYSLGNGGFLERIHVVSTHLSYLFRFLYGFVSRSLLLALLCFISVFGKAVWY